MQPPSATTPGAAAKLKQRRDALTRANDIRTRRAQLKRELKAGRRRIEEVLLDPPDCVATAAIVELLTATPKRRRTTASRLLTRCGISPIRQVGALTERQRRLLVSELHDRTTWPR